MSAQSAHNSDRGLALSTMDAKQLRAPKTVDASLLTINKLVDDALVGDRESQKRRLNVSQWKRIMPSSRSR
jgi:hypothetical protein